MNSVVVIFVCVIFTLQAVLLALIVHPGPSRWRHHALTDTIVHWAHSMKTCWDIFNVGILWYCCISIHVTDTPLSFHVRPVLICPPSPPLRLVFHNVYVFHMGTVYAWVCEAMWAVIFGSNLYSIFSSVCSCALICFMCALNLSSLVNTLVFFLHCTQVLCPVGQYCLAGFASDYVRSFHSGGLYLVS